MSWFIGPVQASPKSDETPSLISKACVISIVAGIVSLSGCDRTRTTSQSITIAVEDSRGLPVPNSRVRIKESWESWQTWPTKDQESERAFYRERWDSDPWYEGSTNAQGKAVLELVMDALDWTIGSEPPAFRDWVSNREYLVRFRSQDAQDELRVLMKPGSVGKGRRYTVKIEAIQKPVYRESE